MESNATNLVEIYQRAFATHAEREALGVKKDGQWEWVTFRELGQQVDECRGGLAALGVGPGDRVAIVAENRVEWVVACYATYGLEAVFIPMYPAQRPEDWRFILRDCGARVVFGSETAYETLRAIAEELPALEHVIGIGRPEDEPSSFAALLGAGRADPVPARSPSADAIAGFIYTSGTTGMPKGVILSHGNIASNINAMREVFPLEPEERSLSFLPWAHSFGQVCELHFALSCGCSCALNDAIPNLLENLAEVRPTLLVAVPRIFNKIYDVVMQQIAHKPRFLRTLFADGIQTASRKRAGERVGLLREIELSLDDKLIFEKVRQKFGGRLKYAFSASAALDPEVAEFVDALGIEVYEGYGLSETSPTVTMNSRGHRKIGTVGQVIPGVRVEIDQTLGTQPGEGEVIVYGPNVMQGYHNRPEENARAFTPDGGLRTGDLGFFDEEKFLHISGRIKEQYKLETGKYVMPAPVEEHLALSPYIAQMMMYGDNRPYNVAIVVPERATVREWLEHLDHPPADEKAAIEELIQREIAERGRELRSYEVPRKVLVVDEELTTGNGMLTPTLKVKRRSVLERHGAELAALYGA